MVVVVTLTLHVALLPLDSLTVIVAFPAPTDCTVKLPDDDAVTVATLGSLLTAVNVPPYDRSIAENTCVRPVPLNDMLEGINSNAGTGVELGPGDGVGVGGGKPVGSAEGATVGAWVGAVLGAGVGVDALAGTAYRPR